MFLGELLGGKKSTSIGGRNVSPRALANWYTGFARRLKKLVHPFA